MGKLYNRIQDNQKRKALRNEMPKAEVLLWIELKGKKMLNYKFRRQYGFGKFVVDFYCPELRLAIEIDGATHYTDKEIKYDAERESIIANFKVFFLRFTNPEIYTDMSNVLEKIKLTIKNLECEK